MDWPITNPLNHADALSAVERILEESCWRLHPELMKKAVPEEQKSNEYASPELGYAQQIAGVYLDTTSFYKEGHVLLDTNRYWEEFSPEGNEELRYMITCHVEDLEYGNNYCGNSVREACILESLQIILQDIRRFERLTSFDHISEIYSKLQAIAETRGEEQSVLLSNFLDTLEANKNALVIKKLNETYKTFQENELFSILSNQIYFDKRWGILHKPLQLGGIVWSSISATGHIILDEMVKRNILSEDTRNQLLEIGVYGNESAIEEMIKERQDDVAEVNKVQETMKQLRLAGLLTDAQMLRLQKQIKALKL